MKEELRKLTNVSLSIIVLIGIIFPVSVGILSVYIPSAWGYPSGQNVTNTQHNWSGGSGAPTTECTSNCIAGTDSVFFNFTFYDQNKATNAEDKIEGGMNPVNHTIWIHINDTANTSWIRNFTGSSGFGANAVFTVTRTDITTYGKVNVSFEWSIPAYFGAGKYYTNFNVTDNATTFTTSEIWQNSTFFQVQAEGIAVELRKHDGTLEDIDVGRWGNITVTPGDTNVEWDTNYVRVENTGDFNTQQFTVDFTPSSWTSDDTGDSITINANIEWTGCWTNYSTDNPGNNFVSEGSTWIAWQSDTTGSYEFEFYATGEFIWVKIRVLNIPSPLSGAVDYNAAYTVTTSGVG